MGKNTNPPPPFFPIDQGLDRYDAVFCVHKVEIQFLGESYLILLFDAQTSIKVFKMCPKLLSCSGEELIGMKIILKMMRFLFYHKRI